MNFIPTIDIVVVLITVLLLAKESSLVVGPVRIVTER
jgi:hypothetical protein